MFPLATTPSPPPSAANAAWAFWAPSEFAVSG